MLAVTTRSGLIETIHEGAVAAVSPDGELIAHSGDIDRPFYLRSAAKPFQALVAQQMGAGLAPVELALAAGSHDGQPAHVAIVESMLSAAGLGESMLGCPPSWPIAESAKQRLVAAGSAEPRPIWHNCSGKHASWLRASVASGLSPVGYLDPGHPVQKAVVDLVSEMGGHPADPVGVDGCGAPVLRTTTRVMALLYARLATLGELREVREAMHRYPALVSGVGNGDALLATALDAVAKRGAAGCLGLALRGRLGLAVKSWDGSQLAAGVAMAATLAALGEIPSATAASTIDPVAHPPVLGGGRVVGAVEPAIELVRLS